MWRRSGAGLVVGEVGRGTFIQSRGGGEEARGSSCSAGRRTVIDLSICRPPPARAPNHVERLRQLFAELSADADMDPMLACRPLVGMDRHRAAAARWLEGLGVPAAPERVVITNGCAHALLVALATLTEPGNLVLTDRLTDHGLISLATVLHFRLRGLPCDGEGILPEAFEQACRAGDVKVLVTTPTLNNPTSTLMGADRRRRIAAIAEAHGVAVVEDDVFRPLVADPPPTLASFLPDLAFHITSFTKSTVSGLRTGYLTAPAGTIERLTARVRTTSWMASALLAEIATRWIEDGTARDMAAWQRNELAARQAIAAEVLAGQQIAAHPNRHQCLADPAGRLARRQLRRPAPPAGRRRRRVGAVRGRPPCTAARGAPQPRRPPRPAASCARAWTGSPPSCSRARSRRC